MRDGVVILDYYTATVVRAAELIDGPNHGGGGGGGDGREGEQVLPMEEEENLEAVTVVMDAEFKSRRGCSFTKILKVELMKSPLDLKGVNYFFVCFVLAIHVL